MNKAKIAYNEALKTQTRLREEKTEIVYSTILNRVNFAARVQGNYHTVIDYKELCDWKFVTTGNEFSGLGSGVVLKLLDDGFRVERVITGKNKFNLEIHFGVTHA